MEDSTQLGKNLSAVGRLARCHWCGTLQTATQSNSMQEILHPPDCSPAFTLIL